MSYKLYTDKKEIFECNIYLEGASLTKASSRIIVETQDLKLMFEGTIDKDGNCKVPIKKLNGLLKEDDSGTMKLEVIAEDTYFNPWESDFEVDTAKKIKVEVRQQGGRRSAEHAEYGNYHKPKMIVQEVKKSKKIKKSINPVDKVVNILHKQNIGISTIYESKKQMIPMLKEYSNKTGYKKGAKKFIKEVIQKLSKK
tara:strand:- start:9 stop:599 length:591 start_codon:yes stop_codon:yes gene_type:complete